MRVTPSTHDTRTIRTTKEPSCAHAHFAQFWKAYPRKVGKKRALKAFSKVKADAECLSAMLAAIARQSASTQWLEASGKFIPHPATWLNDERWTDETTGEQKPKLRVAI